MWLRRRLEETPTTVLSGALPTLLYKRVLILANLSEFVINAKLSMR